MYLFLKRLKALAGFGGASLKAGALTQLGASSLLLGITRARFKVVASVLRQPPSHCTSILALRRLCQIKRLGMALIPGSPLPLHNCINSKLRTLNPHGPTSWLQWPDDILRNHDTTTQQIVIVFHAVELILPSHDNFSNMLALLPAFLPSMLASIPVPCM